MPCGDSPHLLIFAGERGPAGSPPPLHPYPILATQRPQRWTPVTVSVWRLQVQKLISDSEGNCFLLSPIFDRTPVSRDIDCYSLAKISEILAGADILSTPIFVTFSAWRPVQISRYSAGESLPIKAERQAATTHLVTARGKHNIFREKKENISEGLGEVSCCGLCRAKTVRICFRACANILSTPRFCQCQYFVDAEILSTPRFCRRQYFVDAEILSTPRSC